MYKHCFVLDRQKVITWAAKWRQTQTIFDHLAKSRAESLDDELSYFQLIFVRKQEF